MNEKEAKRIPALLAARQPRPGWQEVTTGVRNDARRSIGNASAWQTKAAKSIS